jgi:hypothetical protein
VRNSPHFAFNVVSSALLAIMLWAACAGVGYRILPKPRVAPEEPAGWRQPGVAAGVGLGVLLLFGGFGVLLRIPWWLIVVPFLVVGLAFIVRDLSRAGIMRMRTSVVVIGALSVAALAVVAMAEAPLGLRFRLNVCDDWRAYLPYARRLLATNGLEEPWSSRRVQSLGGFDLLRALPVAVFGDVGVGVVETVVASVFLGGLFVANGVRSTWARLLSLGLILMVPFFWIPRTNTTGVLMGVPLLVIVLATTVELRRAMRSRDRSGAIRWGIGAGLVTAALMSVRPNLWLLAAAILFLGAILATGTKLRERVVVLSAAAASGLVALAPWSIAMWRTGGTPLYPPFGGHLTSAARGNSQLSGLKDVAEHIYDLVREGPYLWVTVGIVVIALVFRRLLPDAPLVVLAAMASGAVTILTAVSSPAATWTTLIRYVAPMSGGVAVFLLVEMMRGADARPRRAHAGIPQWVTPLTGVVAAASVAGLAFSSVGYEIAPFQSGVQLLVKAAKNQIATPGLEVSTPTLRQDFRHAFSRVDPARTIAAVERPYLIDYSRYDIPNLDIPGYMTPDGNGFPYFRGPGPQIARLRRAGFDTLVVTDPVTELCLNPARLEVVKYQRPADRRRYEQMQAWGTNIQTIEQDAPGAVQRYGTLLVIDLPRAQQELSTAST